MNDGDVKKPVVKFLCSKCKDDKDILYRYLSGAPPIYEHGPKGQGTVVRNRQVFRVYCKPCKRSKDVTIDANAVVGNGVQMSLGHKPAKVVGTP